MVTEQQAPAGSPQGTSVPRQGVAVGEAPANETAADGGQGFLRRSPNLRVVWQAARGLFSLGAIIYLSRKYDLWDSLRNISSLNPLYALAGMAVLSGQVMITALRWHSVLRSLGTSPPLPNLFRLSYVAAFLNTCLPAGIAGDVARAWLVRDGKTGLGAAVTSVLLDRVVALLSLLLLAAAVEPFAWRQVAADAGLAAAIPLLALCGLAGTVTLVNADRMTPWLRASRMRIANSLAAALDLMSVNARRVFRLGPGVAALFAFALAGHLAICAAVWIFAAGLGIGIGIAQCLLVVPLVLLVTAVPISLGGWGPREFAMVYLLGLSGVAGSDALTLSIEFGLCATLAGLPGAWIWITLRRGSAQS
jgi:uncharacterized protein (TIRG00374 family)